MLFSATIEFLLMKSQVIVITACVIFHMNRLANWSNRARNEIQSEPHMNVSVSGRYTASTGVRFCLKNAQHKHTCNSTTCENSRRHMVLDSTTWPTISSLGQDVSDNNCVFSVLSSQPLRYQLPVHFAIDGYSSVEQLFWMPELGTRVISSRVSSPSSPLLPGIGGITRAWKFANEECHCNACDCKSRVWLSALSSALTLTELWHRARLSTSAILIVNHARTFNEVFERFPRSRLINSTSASHHRTLFASNSA